MYLKNKLIDLIVVARKPKRETKKPRSLSFLMNSDKDNYKV